MQRRIYYILLFLFINNAAFSQIEVTIASQFDAIASSLTIRGEKFVMGAYVADQMFIIKEQNDSLCVTSYLTSTYNGIGGVFSISVNSDTLFTKTVDSLFSDIKQNHNYQSYSKDLLTSDNIFFVFHSMDKLQLFRRKEASQDQLLKINFIARRLNAYSLIPNKGYGSRMKYLKIEDWKQLLRYLTNGVIDSQPK